MPRRLVMVVAALIVIVVPVALVAGQLTAPAQVDGVVISVVSDAPLHVASFTLRTADGQELTFRVGDLQVGGPYFDAPHLRNHEATSQPVTVTYRMEGATRVAIRLSDAPGTTVPPSASP